MTVHNGRQWSATLRGVRPDHVQRYRFAADFLKSRLWPGSRVLDAACGCGYGSAMLADAGLMVDAVDIDEEAIEYARRHWSRPDVFYAQGDFSALTGQFQAIVCFEALEHIHGAPEAVHSFFGAAPILVCSVPNEDVVPFAGHEHHVRHYRPGEFTELLSDYLVVNQYGQSDKSPGLVTPYWNEQTRTLVAVATR